MACWKLRRASVSLCLLQTACCRVCFVIMIPVGILHCQFAGRVATYCENFWAVLLSVERSKVLYLWFSGAEYVGRMGLPVANSIIWV